MTLKYLAETDVVSFTSQPSRLQAWLRERWQDFADALLRTLKQDDEQVRVGAWLLNELIISFRPYHSIVI